MFARSVLNLVGAAAVLGALVATLLPLGLDAVDRAGEPIPCGSGAHPNYQVAAQQDRLNLDQHTLAGPGYMASDYVEQCSELVGARRTAAFSVAGAGAGLVLVGWAGPLIVRSIRLRRGRQAQYPGAAEAVRNQPDHAGVGAQWFTDQVGAGFTQPVLEKPVGEQVGRQSYAAMAAAALRGNGFGHTRRPGGGEGQFYAVAGHR
jgi:hypothetical protein